MAKILRLHNQMASSCFSFHMMGVNGDYNCKRRNTSTTATKNKSTTATKNKSTTATKNKSEKKISDKKNTKSKMIRLILWDGRVQIYDRPIKVLELINQYPKHMVCHSDSFCLGRKVPTLSEKDRLQLGEKYFLLPMDFFQSALTFMNIISSLHKSQFVMSLCNGRLNIFDVCKTESGLVQVKMTDDFIEKLVHREDPPNDIKSMRLCTTPKLEKEYKQLVSNSKLHLWKPTLQPISEKKTFSEHVRQ